MHNTIIWGNHSSTQFPDAAHGFVNTPDGKKTIYDAVKDDAWLKGEFIKVTEFGTHAHFNILFCVSLLYFL